MKQLLKIFFIVLAIGFSASAFAQGDGSQKTKSKHRTQESGSGYDPANDPSRPEKFSATPGGFTVTKYKESKVKKKLKKGESQSRFSVPNPKGKPLKHKKKHKFLFFG